MRLNRRISKKYYLIFPVAFIILILSPIFMRAILIPASVKILYSHSVNSTFNRELGPTNQRLTNLGFTFPAHNENDCSDASYSKFREVVTCEISQSSTEFNVNPEFVSHWRKGSQEIENSLLNNGWRKEHDASQPISKIYDNPNVNAAIGVVYSQDLGKSSCTLEIFNRAYRGAQNTTFAHEWCTRYVSFFGDSLE